MTHSADPIVGENLFLQEVLGSIICPNCDHQLRFHVDKYGCEVEHGDCHPPCSCTGGDFAEVRVAIKALRKVKGVA